MEVTIESIKINLNNTEEDILLKGIHINFEYGKGSSRGVIPTMKTHTVSEKVGETTPIARKSGRPKKINTGGEQKPVKALDLSEQLKGFNDED